MIITNLSESSDLFRNVFHCHKVQAVCPHSGRKQIFVTSKNHFIGFRAYLLYKYRFSKCDIQSFSLSDRITGDSFVTSENFTVFVHKIAFRHFSLTVPVDKSCIIVIIHKADLLRIFFVCGRKSDLFCHDTDLVFGVLTYRHQCPL